MNIGIEELLEVLIASIYRTVPLDDNQYDIIKKTIQLELERLAGLGRL